MDVRIPHPVPLAVQDVVPEFHVFEDLAEAQQCGAGDPGGLVLADQQQSTAGELQTALDLDHAADVGGVGGPALGEDAVLDGVEFAAQLRHLLVGEVGGRGGTQQRAAGLGEGPGRVFATVTTLAAAAPSVEPPADPSSKGLSASERSEFVGNNRHAVILLRGRG